MGVSIARASPSGRSLDDILLPDRALEADHAFVLQLADDRDDLLLGGLDLLDLDGAQGLHVLAQHLPAALRKTAEDLVAQLLAGALEGDRQQLAVDLAEDFLEAERVD